jgi:hypothetical protein
LSSSKSSTSWFYLFIFFFFEKKLHDSIILCSLCIVQNIIRHASTCSVITTSCTKKTREKNLILSSGKWTDQTREPNWQAEEFCWCTALCSESLYEISKPKMQYHDDGYYKAKYCPSDLFPFIMPARFSWTSFPFQSKTSPIICHPFFILYWWSPSPLHNCHHHWKLPNFINMHHIKKIEYIICSLWRASWYLTCMNCCYSWLCFRT